MYNYYNCDILALVHLRIYLHFRLDYYKIPLKVMPTNNSTVNPVCADAIVHLVSILAHEEHDAYMFHQQYVDFISRDNLPRNGLYIGLIFP